MVEQLRNVYGGGELIGYVKEWRLAVWAWMAVIHRKSKSPR